MQAHLDMLTTRARTTNGRDTDKEFCWCFANSRFTSRFVCIACIWSKLASVEHAKEHMHDFIDLNCEPEWTYGADTGISIVETSTKLLSFCQIYRGLVHSTTLFRFDDGHLHLLHVHLRRAAGACAAPTQRDAGLQIQIGTRLISQIILNNSRSKHFLILLHVKKAGKINVCSSLWAFWYGFSNQDTSFENRE